MIVGKRMRRPLDERHKNALSHALEKIRANDLFCDINEVFLYGSCARGDFSFSSDIDLFVELKESAFDKKQHDQILALRNEMLDASNDEPEIDIHFTIGPEWRNSRAAYHTAIRREGKRICL